MGGYGSGNWHRWNTKTTVERCWPLDVNRLSRDRLLRGYASGVLCWTNTLTDERVGSAGFDVMPVVDEELKIFTLRYRWNHSEDIDLPIRLEATYPYFGGRRWWFACPLSLGGVPCGRRVGKLYLPGNARYFGCRHCHDLTYYSCQTSHQRERAMLQLDRMWAEAGRTR